MKKTFLFGLAGLALLIAVPPFLKSYGIYLFSTWLVYVIANMGFRPLVSGSLKTMDSRIFKPELMGLSADIHAKPRAYRSARVAQWHEDRGRAKA